MLLSGPPLEKQIPIWELLRRGVETKPDARALVSAQGGYTWRELDEMSKRYATNLLGLGLQKRGTGSPR